MDFTWQHPAHIPNRLVRTLHLFRLELDSQPHLKSGRFFNHVLPQKTFTLPRFEVRGLQLAAMNKNPVRWGGSPSCVLPVRCLACVLISSGVNAPLLTLGLDSQLCAEPAPLVSRSHLLPH